MSRLPFPSPQEALIGLLLALTPAPSLADETTTPSLLDAKGAVNIRVNDPSMVLPDGQDYYLYSTGVGLRAYRSTDLKDWNPLPTPIPAIPTWVKELIPSHRGHFWAPDLIHLNNQFLLYCSVSSFGKNTSAIALTTSPSLNPNSPDYNWTDQGTVIQSAPPDDFNAIDPAITLTPDGKLWMAFGSFWSGIKLIELNPATGKRISTDSPIYALAHSDAIEAPHIHHHNGFYYLFVNWGTCCQGINSTYNIRIGRSPTITGPYLDREGKDMLHGGGSLFLSSEGAQIGPGHANVWKATGQLYFSCHFYDGTDQGKSKLTILPLTYDENGWPTLNPLSKPSSLKP